MSADPLPSGVVSRSGVEGEDLCAVSIGDLSLERGGVLPGVVVAFESWGELNAAADNAILVEHALTGDSHVVGAAGPGHPTPGWWEGLIGPGAPLDTDRFFVVATNVLGGCQGTTGPSTPDEHGVPWGSRFPFVTIRDQVLAEARVADVLGIRRWRAVLGGSMGGMRALEWAVSLPDRVRTTIVLASTAASTADQIAWSQPQLLAIRQDPDFAGGDYYGGPGPRAGLGLARRIAHLTYRSETEVNDRFGRSAQGEEDPLGGGGRFAVESYLDHHADKLVNRFDANSYVVLTEAMNSHDVGRGRGGVSAALSGVSAELVVAGIDSDRCYPAHLSASLAAAVPGARYVLLTSPHGHDGFLVEIEQVGRLITDVLSTPIR